MPSAGGAAWGRKWSVSMECPMGWTLAEARGYDPGRAVTMTSASRSARRSDALSAGWVNQSIDRPPVAFTRGAARLR